MVVLGLASEDILCVRIFGWQFSLTAGGMISGWKFWGWRAECVLCARIYALHFASGWGEEVESCILINCFYWFACNVIEGRCRRVVRLSFLRKAAYLEARCRGVVRLELLPKAAYLAGRYRGVVPFRVPTKED